MIHVDNDTAANSQTRAASLGTQKYLIYFIRLEITHCSVRYVMFGQCYPDVLGESCYCNHTLIIIMSYLIHL